MTIEELIQEVANRNLRLNNLFQLDNGRWQANITDGSRFWEFGKGATAGEALIAALQKTLTTTPEYGIERPIRASQEYQPRRATKAPTPILDF
jgi:hypothetical protein